MPRTALSKRTDFMRKCAQNLPILASQKDAITVLMNKIDGHARIRHSVLHGFFSNYDKPSEMLTFTSLRGKGDYHEQTDMSGTVPQLQKAATAAFELDCEVVAYMHAFAQAFLGSEYEVNQTGGEGTV